MMTKLFSLVLDYVMKMTMSSKNIVRSMRNIFIDKREFENSIEISKV